MSTENEGAAVTSAAESGGTGSQNGTRAGTDAGSATSTSAEHGAGTRAAGTTAPGTAAGDGAAEGRTAEGRTPESTDTQGPSMSKPESTPESNPPAQPATPPQPAAPPHPAEQPQAPAGFGSPAPPGGAWGAASASGSGQGPGAGSASGPGGPGDPGSTTPGGLPPYGGPYGGDPYGSGPAGPGGPQQPWGAPPAPGGRPPGGKRISGGLIAAIVVVALVAGGVGGGLGFWASERNDSSGSTTTITSGGSDPKTLNRSPKSVAGIAAKALPSVVTIETSGNGEKGTGTGFVYDKEGHILTNNHVVADAAKGGKLTATFSDGKKYAAQIVGRAQGYDVAVIKLKNADGRKLNPLALGKSNEVQVGDASIAIGAPFGLSGTVTTGIISAKNRPVASSDGQGSNASYMNALQTDASINPGNSGGPLLNADGSVIGINSAIQPGSSGGGGLGGESQSGSVGLGFAIPVNQAERVAGQLIKTGTPVYPVIGATVTMDQKGNGATIAQSGQSGQDPITSGGPADKAGLKPGDVITKFDGTSIDSGPTLIGNIWTHKPGDKVKLTYKRHGKESTTDVTLGSRKGDQ